MAGEAIVIIGAGECGARAAFALREQGHLGSITLAGSEAHAPYERPPLSKAALIEDGEPAYVADPGRYETEAITLMAGQTVEEIEVAAGRVRLKGGASLAYDRLLLATGARPRALPGTNPNSRRIRTLRTHSDAMAIRTGLGPGRRILIIGGGFIGLELAATARTSGAHVTLIETQPRLLSRGVPAELAERIAECHREHGVDLRCGARIASISEDSEFVTIVFEDGSSIVADLLVVGIGAVPNTELAQAAGLVIDNGIAVDAELRTSAENIYAAGDCCSFPLALYGDRRVRLEAWRNAQDQGRLAARNLMGGREQHAAVPWFWSDQYDLTLQVAGLGDGAEQVVSRRLDEDAIILFHLDGDGRLLAASGLGRGNAIARDIRLAEMLIAAAARPDPAALSDPDTKLKSLLAR